MRMLLTATMPHEPFNTLVRQKKAGAIVGRIMETLKPQAAYFTEMGGRRTAVLVVEVADASRIPFFAEPFFLAFNADCQFSIAMTPEDLGKAGLDQLGEQWG